MFLYTEKRKAQEIWKFSIDLCQQVNETVKKLNLKCEYKREGYLVIAIDEVEANEIEKSVALLKEMGFYNELWDKNKLQKNGFKNVVAARYEPESAQAHPVKFRNSLLEHCLSNGVKYRSGVKVLDVNDSSEAAFCKTVDGEFQYEAIVLANNAFINQVSPYFDNKKLVEPFKGQIITSTPLQYKFPVPYPHSFDHGYEYALVTADNRLMIGGWRNNIEGMETGTYDMSRNNSVDEGLKEFVSKYYQISEKIDWEYSWAGLMASSQSGFPYIGPFANRLFCCCGYTGHGFSWAHGSARLLANIMMGESYDPVAQYFNPRL